MAHSECVYVLRLDQPLGSDKHKAQFYVGHTYNLERRLDHHRKGTGAAFTRAAAERGIDFHVVLVIPGADRREERRIKNLNNTQRFVERYLRKQAGEQGASR